MYHDQALIPLKTVDFEGGVNITLGLPFVRTSPDHGTALGIAGQGVASAASRSACSRCVATRAANSRSSSASRREARPPVVSIDISPGMSALVRNPAARSGLRPRGEGASR